MRTLLGFLMFVMVSGDEETKLVTARQNENVLLPCTCKNRNLTEKFQWQKEGAQTELVWSNKYNSTTHASRVETFIDDDSSNCSILLKNISEDDHGTYQCNYFQPNYQSDKVNLLVCKSEPLQQNFTQSNGVKVFKCEVKICDNKTELLWTSDDKSLEISSKFTISNNSTLVDGIFHVTSTVEMNLTDITSSSEIKCDMHDSTQSQQQSVSHTDTNIITVLVLVVGLGLVAGLGLFVLFINFKKWQKRNETNPCRCLVVVQSCIGKSQQSKGDADETETMLLSTSPQLK